MFPSDLALTRDQSIAVADIGSFCVRVFNLDGTMEGHFGDATIFSLPISLTVNHIGYYIVYDQGHQRITFHSSVGQFLKEIPTTEAGIVHKICSTYNKLYLNDPTNKIITVYSCNNIDVELITRLTALDHETAMDHETAPPSTTEDGDDDPEESEPSTALEPSTSQVIEHATSNTTDDDDEEEDPPAASPSDTSIRPSTVKDNSFFLDCSAIATDQHGTLYISDQLQNKVHCLNCRGELSSIKFSGKAVLRPSFITVSTTGTMTIRQQGVDTLSEGEDGVTINEAVTTNNNITMYRLLAGEN